jgi:hypothetical protein
LHLVEGGDLLGAHLFGNVIRRYSFAPQILVEQLTVLDQDDRFAFENLPEGLDAVGDVRRDDLHNGQRRHGDDRAGDGVVVLGEALLDGVAEHDEQNQVKRRECG